MRIRLRIGFDTLLDSLKVGSSIAAFSVPIATIGMRTSASNGILCCCASRSMGPVTGRRSTDCGTKSFWQQCSSAAESMVTNTKVGSFTAMIE